MNNRDEPLTPEERRKLFVCDALCRETSQHCWGHQNDTDARIDQALVDSPHHRHPEAKVLLAEPYADTARFEQIMQFFGGGLPVIPCMTEEHISKVWLRGS